MLVPVVQRHGGNHLPLARVLSILEEYLTTPTVWRLCQYGNMLLGSTSSLGCKRKTSRRCKLEDLVCYVISIIVSYLIILSSQTEISARVCGPSFWLNFSNPDFFVDEILLSSDKTVAIIDGSGVLADPAGLNREELIRLAKLRVPVGNFDKSKLSKEGYLVKVEEQDVKLPCEPLWLFALSHSAESSFYSRRGGSWWYRFP